MIDDKKSQLIASTRKNFIDFDIDSKSYSIELPNEKRERLIAFITAFVTKNTCSITELAQLIGKLIAACPVIQYGLLYTRVLEREKIKALFINDENYDVKIPIPKSILPELDWWLENLPSSSNSIETFDFAPEIFTDASNSGWGATNKTNSIHGFGDEKQKRYHINYKES